MLQDRPVDQTGIVVTDLERGLRAYASLWGIGPWGALHLRPWLQIELIEPIRGPSVYCEYLERHGEGLHHVGVYVPSLDEAVASLEARSYELLQLGQGYGLDGDGGYAYFDIVHDFGPVIEVPHRRRQPESTWPPA